MHAVYSMYERDGSPEHHVTKLGHWRVGWRVDDAPIEWRTFMGGDVVTMNIAGRTLGVLRKIPSGGWLLCVYGFEFWHERNSEGVIPLPHYSPTCFVVRRTAAMKLAEKVIGEHRNLQLH